MRAFGLARCRPPTKHSAMTFRVSLRHSYPQFRRSGWVRTLSLDQPASSGFIDETAKLGTQRLALRAACCHQEKAPRIVLVARGFGCLWGIFLTRLRCLRFQARSWTRSSRRPFARDFVLHAIRLFPEKRASTVNRAVPGAEPSERKADKHRTIARRNVGLFLIGQSRSDCPLSDFVL
jgi:hypothetical protein